MKLHNTAVTRHDKNTTQCVAFLDFAKITILRAFSDDECKNGCDVRSLFEISLKNFSQIFADTECQKIVRSAYCFQGFDIKTLPRAKSIRDIDHNFQKTVLKRVMTKTGNMIADCRLTSRSESASNILRTAYYFRNFA